MLMVCFIPIFPYVKRKKRNSATFQVSFGLNLSSYFMNYIDSRLQYYFTTLVQTIISVYTLMTSIFHF